MFSYTIYEFSRLYSEESNQKESLKKTKSIDLLLQKPSANQQLPTSKRKNQVEKMAISSKEKQDMEYKCQICKKPFESQKGLNGHMRVH
jgi:aspartate carbamoyltransferase regulatory subunit